MTKINVSMDTLDYLNMYAIMNNLNINDISISSVINILNVHDMTYQLVQCDDDVEVCIVNKKDVIIGNVIKSGKECCICLDDFKINNKIVKLGCTHIFHADCLFKSIRFNNSCPMCRQHIQVFLR